MKLFIISTMSREIILNFLQIIKSCYLVQKRRYVLVHGRIATSVTTAETSSGGVTS